MASKRFCATCPTELSTQRRRAAVLHCAKCDANTVPRVEVVIRPQLRSLVMFPPSAEDDTLFGQTCDVVKRRRPDEAWFGDDRVVLCEVDENGGHGTRNYTPECDFGWVMDMVSTIVELYRRSNFNGGRVPHIFVIRWNPDEYDGGHVLLRDRIATAAQRINHYLMCDLAPYTPGIPHIEYHFYHTKCQAHIDWAKSQVDAARVTVL